jgi:hypothetical protein
MLIAHGQKTSLPLCFALFLLLCSSLQPDVLAKSNKFNNKDKLEIVKLTLEEVLAPTSNFLTLRQREHGIILSSRNLRKGWAQELACWHVRVLGPLDIERRSWREGSFQYLEFNRLSIEGDKVIVRLEKIWAQGPYDYKQRTERSRIVLEFKKTEGGFSRTVIEQFVSEY